MAKPLLPDGLWERIKPLLPPEPPRPKGGRPRVSDRLALTGILFVARTGTAWELLPPELGCGSGMTCWRRLRDWQVSGVWQKVWHVLLDELGLADTAMGSSASWQEVHTSLSENPGAASPSAACHPSWRTCGRRATWGAVFQFTTRNWGYLGASLTGVMTTS